MTEKDSYFMQKAIDLAQKGADSNSGGPFGAVIVMDNKIIAEGYNRVTSTNDPTAHAEIVAIKKACEKLNSFQLDDCVIYTSCEPCPMCLGAIYWARPKKVYYACNRNDAAVIDFDDQFIYTEIQKKLDQRKIEFQNIMRQEGLKLFKAWKNNPNTVKY
ncbi:MAG: nucleoside deaminase [Flavobacteriaceae bacterium]|nr:nucleoside deaminase [Flavobacteriaceae bacterium]